jgi:hypothetical protein
MTKNLILSLAGIVACSGLSTVALAATPSTKTTCEEFIQLDEVSRPKLVYFLDGFDRKGDAIETVDFDQNDRLVPVIVEECTKNPKHLLAKKIKAVQKKTASN